MRYYRTATDAGYQLIAKGDQGTYNLTSADEDLRAFADLASVAKLSGATIDEVTENVLEEASEVTLHEGDSLRPVNPDEVWAAGMTYEISREAREEEQETADIYLEAYDAERPVLFHKATSNRTVGPDEPVGIRADSDWDVPEPELGIVLYDEEIVGYTIGNDMSSRSIEGGNAMHQQQAKVFDRCCSLGPCIVSASSVEDPHDIEMEMEIHRDGNEVFEGTTSTSNMVRTCDELVDYYTRHNDLPKLSVLITGTSLVPPDEFTLQDGDIVKMHLEGIGTLENPVTTV